MSAKPERPIGILISFMSASPFPFPFDIFTGKKYPQATAF